ncbi:jg26872 [Pararge aegeria aegeria]|uniref:Jg26872 protein n=1 Tax=Pararge aegeria aegeria TaxID=348720 RepID=A0A8S4SGC6_9NEOP|nr:jg26872 [Pararge aegeria aegeria]
MCMQSTQLGGIRGHDTSRLLVVAMATRSAITSALAAAPQSHAADRAAHRAQADSDFINRAIIDTSDGVSKCAIGGV